MYQVITEVTFEAAHQVPGHPKCGNLHGHTWRIVVCIEAGLLMSDVDEAAHPFVVDFGDVKRWLDANVPDHRFMNEVYPFVPTSENLARHFFEVMGLWVDTLNTFESNNRPGRLRVVYVEVWEGLKNRARYFDPFRKSQQFDQVDQPTPEQITRKMLDL